METPKEYPCHAACASQWRQPSLLAMTHMRWFRGQTGHESTSYTLSVVLCVGPTHAETRFQLQRLLPKRQHTFGEATVFGFKKLFSSTRFHRAMATEGHASEVQCPSHPLSCGTRVAVGSGTRGRGENDDFFVELHANDEEHDPQD